MDWKNITEDDLIIIVGGGNIGDVYIEAEEIRQVIIRKYPQNEIIVFPSTIFYQNTSKNNEIYQKVWKYIIHIKIIFVCTWKILLWSVKKFYPHCKVYLLPDIVFSYPYITNNLPRENKILLCLRHDAEGVLSENQINKILDVCKAKCKNVFFTDTFIENVYAPDDSKRKEIIQN